MHEKRGRFNESSNRWRLYSVAEAHRYNEKTFYHTERKERKSIDNKYEYDQDMIQFG